MPTDDQLEELAAAEGVRFTRSDDTVVFGSVEINDFSEGGQWFDPSVKDILPRRGPRGDLRERMVNLLVRDAVANPGRIPESALFGEDDQPGAFASYELIQDAEKRPTFGEILLDHYVVEPSRRTRFLFPFQTDLPGNFEFRGRYKLFNGIILAFFAQPGRDERFNEELLSRFYELFNADASLSLLDQHVLNIARATANGGAGRQATAAQLLDGTRRNQPTYREELQVDPLMPAVHERVQRDLQRALDMTSLGRKDRVNATLTVFYLHLALFLWRAAFVLEEQVRAFFAVLADEPSAAEALERAADTTLEQSPFRGQLRFRVAAARPRPISQADPAAQSFREINNQRLRLLPVNLSLLAASRRLTNASAPATFADIADALRSDPSLKASFNAACRAASLAIAEHLNAQQRLDIEAGVRTNEPGLIALRSAIIKRWRSDLRRSSTDITAGLMKRGGRGIFATRGNVQYFELGQDLLLLLTKLIAGEEAIRYRDFLDELSLYGLAPQNRDEEAHLAETLRSLQLLEKFSDTGEAMYVKHFL
jgi:hypothetical protein